MRAAEATAGEWGALPSEWQEMRRVQRAACVALRGRPGGREGGDLKGP